MRTRDWPHSVPFIDNDQSGARLQTPAENNFPQIGDRSTWITGALTPLLENWIKLLLGTCLALSMEVDLSFGTRRRLLTFSSRE